MLTREFDSKEKRTNYFQELQISQPLSVHPQFDPSVQCWSSSLLTCCKEWRRWPSPRLCRWCGWRQSRPAVCWSRSGSRREWSSSGETWGRRSTVSPAHEASRHGRSYKPWPPEERRPEENTHSWDGNNAKQSEIVQYHTIRRGETWQDMMWNNTMPYDETRYNKTQHTHSWDEYDTVWYDVM